MGGKVIDTAVAGGSTDFADISRTLTPPNFTIRELLGRWQLAILPFVPSAEWSQSLTQLLSLDTAIIARHSHRLCTYCVTCACWVRSST